MLISNSIHNLQHLTLHTPSGDWDSQFNLHMLYAREKGAEVRDPCLPNGDSHIFHIEMEQLWVMGQAKIVFGPGCSTKTIWAVNKEIVDDMNDLVYMKDRPYEEHKDLMRVLNQDLANLDKFEHSTRYQKWTENKSSDQIKFMLY